MNTNPITLEQFLKMSKTDLAHHVYALTVGGKIALRTCGDQGSPGNNGTSFLVGNIPPTTEGNNGDSYLDTNTCKIHKKTAGIWNVGVSLGCSSSTPTPTTGGITGLVKDSTGTIIGRWKDGLLKETFFDLITNGIGVMTIQDNFIIG